VRNLDNAQITAIVNLMHLVAAQELVAVQLGFRDEADVGAVRQVRLSERPQHATSLLQTHRERLEPLYGNSWSFTRVENSAEKNAEVDNIHQIMPQSNTLHDFFDCQCMRIDSGSRA
jgi:hypothetical protein